MNTKSQNLRAKRTLSHAIRYLRGESVFGSETEASAVDLLRTVLGKIYLDHRSRFSRAIIRHRCVNCSKYRAAAGERR